MEKKLTPQEVLSMDKAIDKSQKSVAQVFAKRKVQNQGRYMSHLV